MNEYYGSTIFDRIYFNMKLNFSDANNFIVLTTDQKQMVKYLYANEVCQCNGKIC